MLYPKYAHSASSGNLWMDARDVFLWRYGFQKWGKDSPRAQMGVIAEEITYQALLQGLSPEDASKLAQETYDAKFQGEVHEEREYVGGITAKFVTALSELGKPLTYQASRTVELGAFAKGIKVKTDLGYDNLTVDLKATLRVPSSPKPAHLRQASLYAKLTGKPQKLLYASDKKIWGYVVTEEDVEKNVPVLFGAFRTIEGFAKMFPTPEAALSAIAFNPDTYYWKDYDIEEARKAWQV